MSRSFHVTERQRKKDNYLNRDDTGAAPQGLSKLDELSLRKLAAKSTEAWKRDAKKAGGLSYTKFTFTEKGWDVRKQKCRGAVSDVASPVVPPKKKKALTDRLHPTPR